MVMPNRAESTSDYRYGFNDVEMDDEIKSQKGTSYDFGARMYDSRVGRWLTIDAASSLKPDVSPYLGLADNPIVFRDPDGNDEWNVVVIKNQNGQVVRKMSMRVSQYNIKSGGVFEVSDGGGGYYRMSNGFDFKNVMTLQYQDDGSLKDMGTKVVLLKSHGIKDREYGAFAKSKGTKYGSFFGDGYEQAGGYYGYSKDGGGCKYYTKTDAKGLDIDEIMLIVGVLGKSGYKSFSGGAKKLEKQANMWRKVEKKVGDKGDEDYSVQSKQSNDEVEQTLEKFYVDVITHNGQGYATGDPDGPEEFDSFEALDKKYPGAEPSATKEKNTFTVRVRAPE